ncbi:MAG: hypothetical protein JWO66_413 [Candidatus Eremiobacteraeota bacterium]|nr:hypothetical protein [Candidatus Eremiobacteraeota bacterium]
MAVQPDAGVLDISVRESYEWLADVMQETGLDQPAALHALRAVLHAVRDETTVRQSGHIATQMPTFIRGLYFEGWDPARVPVGDRSRERFLERIRSYVPDDLRDGLDYERIARGVFHVLERRLPNASLKIKQLIPSDIRALWTSPSAEHVVERKQRLAAEERLATTEALHAEHGTERDAPLAPHQNRPPGEQHRGGPLPNTM